MTRRNRSVLNHLGSERMLPNSYNGIPISQEQATKLIGTCTDRKLPKGLLFNTNYKLTFDITKWTVHNIKDKPIKYVLLPENATKKTKGSIVYTGCFNDNNTDSLDMIMQASILMERYFTNTREDDVMEGQLSAWSQNYSRGVRIQAAIHAKESDKNRIEGIIYTILNQCKEIFINQFINKGVGFEELLEDLKQVFYAQRNVPLCYVSSTNLSNSEHIDTGDHSRSFAFWVTKDKYEGAYLLFPQWGLAFELGHGRFISWNGNECAHCSSVPIISGNNNDRKIYSLFTALTKTLYNETMKIRRCDSELVKRHQLGWAETHKSLLSNLRVGMMVQIRVIPSVIYKKFQNEKLKSKMWKTSKKYHYYQTNVIIKITSKSITLKRAFKKTFWKRSIRKAWFNLVVDKKK